MLLNIRSYNVKLQDEILFICQNKGSSLVPKYKRKPVFLGLDSSHPDMEI